MILWSERAFLFLEHIMEEGWLDAPNVERAEALIEEYREGEDN